MSKEEEVVAYAITHAPPGVKGGPYTGRMRHVWTLAEARRLTRVEAHEKCPRGARVIRIVRKARLSEASAVEVLRELVAWSDRCDLDMDDVIPIADRARRVLAASGPDPLPVVRAAMVRADAHTTCLVKEQCGRDTTRAQMRWANAEKREDCAVDAYRKAGGK